MVGTWQQGSIINQEYHKPKNSRSQTCTTKNGKLINNVVKCTWLRRLQENINILRKFCHLFKSNFIKCSYHTVLITCGSRSEPLYTQKFGQKLHKNCSVADPGCLSRIPDPDFYPSRIPDLGSRIQKQYQKREMKKNFVIILFSVVTNSTKLNIMLFLKC